MIVTSLIVGLGVYLRARQVTDRQIQLARSVAYAVDDYVDSAGLVLQTMERVAETVPHREIEIYAQAILEGYGYFAALYQLDERGIVTMHVPRDPNYDGLDMSNQPYFRQSREQSGIAISEPFISLDTGQLAVYMTWSLTDGTVVVGELDLGKLQDAIDAALDVPSRNVVYVVDRSGMLLAHPRFELVEQQTNCNSNRSLTTN